MQRDEPGGKWRGRNPFARGVQGACTHHLIEAQAALTPRATALTYEGDSLSYEELNRRADRLADGLRSRGVGPNTPVGHFFERGLEMVVGVLGILKAGGAYVPLAPDYPKDRLRFMLQDSGAGLLLSHARLAGAAPEFRGEVVLLDEISGRTDAGPRASAPKARPSDLAYVIYTSGSTGRPKGVEVPHRALVNLLRSTRRRPGLAARDVWLAVTPLSFDIAGLEILLPLTVGARCEIAGRQVATSGGALSAHVAGCGATVMQATPATWHMLLEAGWEGHGSFKVLCGGEAMSRGLADRLLARCGSLWNLYGPTETTIWSTVERVRRSAEPVYLGRPVRRTQLHVLDPDMNPVLPGQEGELYIGGAGLARGYRDRPELTAERFVPNPFGGRPGSRLYKTGDLVRPHPGGRLEFVGRLDHQVKVRGHRVELGEIDEALSRHPAVRRAVTLARGGGPDQTRLVSYVLQHPAGAGSPPPATAADFRRHLAERLPGYMVPSAFVTLDTLPLTPNGKIDRAALPAPPMAPPRDAAPFAAPRDELEERLARVWEEGFGTRPIGIDDDFFELGGDSLLASRLAAEIERASGRRFALATLIRAPTIRLLADQLRGAKAAGRSSLVEVQAGGSRPPLFCLPGWTGIVDGQGAFSLRRLAELLGPDQPVYTFQCDARRADAAAADRLEDLASVFVADLLARHPHGPHLLAGYSHGALVAFEMARQLAGRGRPIGLLAVIDMWGVGFPIRLSRLRRWRQRGIAGLCARFSAIARHPFRGFKAAPDVPAHDAAPELLRFDRMVEAYRSSLWTHRLPGRMTLFRAAEAVHKPGFRFDEPYNGCRSLADEVEVHCVPGDHVSLMREPNVQALAAGLRRRLQASSTPAAGCVSSG